MYFILKSLLRLRLQLCSTTYSSLLGCGFQLGGTSFLNNLRNNSIVCGRKNKNYIIKISLTGLQLKKSIKIMYRYIKRRSTFYFVHSHFGFKLLMNQLYNKTNMLYLTFTRFVKSKFNESKICNFFFGNLKKLYFVSKWKPGLITNRTNFLETRKLRKLPVRFPKYGFVNDYNNNIVSVKEFKISRVPFSSLINLSASNTFFGFFDIPGNGLSYDTVFFNLKSAVYSAIFALLQDKGPKFSQPVTCQIPRIFQGFRKTASKVIKLIKFNKIKFLVNFIA